jgi:N6-adenosine-specific RNA methylase IME4
VDGERNIFEALNPPYRTLLADPPWDYPDGFVTQSYGEGWQRTRSYQLPYSAMTVGEIMALPVNDLAYTDARLFLWTTNRYLPEAFAVVAAWGFRYQQTLTWHKTDALNGSVAPNSEFLLVGVRGSPRIVRRAPSAVIAHAHARTHSTKPVEFGDLIESVSAGPYVELFAREPRLGWDHWGLGYEAAAVANP